MIRLGGVLRHSAGTVGVGGATVWMGGTASPPTVGATNPKGSESYAQPFSPYVRSGTDTRTGAGSHTVDHSRIATAAALPRPHFSQRINVSAPSTLSTDPSLLVVNGSLSQEEAKQMLAAHPRPSLSKWHRVLRGDIYDELLKLPLRFPLHDFDVLQDHLHRHSAVGYAPPLGRVRSESLVDDTVDGPDSEPYDVSLEVEDPLPFFVHRTSNGHLPGKIYSMDTKRSMPAFFMRITGVDGDVFRFEEELMKLFPTKKIFVRSHSVYVYNVNLDGRMILHHWLLGLGF